MIEMQEKDGYVRIDAGGKLTKSDYDRLIPRLEAWADERGPMRMLIRLEDFEGWTPAALWADLKYDFRHQKDMARIAVVGESSLERWGTEISKAFFKADLEYFTPSESEKARAWLMAD